jgi:undecaprenyl-diphosphatase
MKNKFSSRDSRLQLLAGVIVFATMTLTLGEISEDVINREPLTVVDAQLSTWLHVHASRPLTTVMLVITALGATWTVTGIALTFLLYLFWRRRFDWLVAVASSVFGGMLLNKLLKYAFHRERPHFDDPILRLTSYSFPSGHTMMATVLYGVLAAYVFAEVKDWRARAMVTLAAGLLILLVGFSRIYLGAHYLSDVLGALAEGLAWLSLCLTVMYSVWGKRNSPPT